MKKLLVFGARDFADVVGHVLEVKLGRQIEAYIVHGRFKTADTFRGKPVVAIEEVVNIYPPEEHEVALAMIGKKMFDEREAAFNQLRDLGYEMINVIDPSAEVDTENIGTGNVILANVSIEAHCSVGNGNIIWQNAALPHHNRIGDFCNLGPSASFSGYSKAGSHCFLGNNSCIKNRTEVPDYTYIGACAYVSRPVEPRVVLVPHRSYVLEGKTGYDFQ